MHKIPDSKQYNSIKELYYKYCKIQFFTAQIFTAQIAKDN